MNRIARFNAKLALLITDAVGSMWCAYAFTALALISLPDAIHGGTATLIQWIAQTFLQLVLLSIIMVGQDVKSEKSEKRAEKDHEMIRAEFELLKAEATSHKELIELLREDLRVSKKVLDTIEGE